MDDATSTPTDTPPGALPTTTRATPPLSRGAVALRGWLGGRYAQEGSGAIACAAAELGWSRQLVDALSGGRVRPALARAARIEVVTGIPAAWWAQDAATGEPIPETRGRKSKAVL